MPNLGAAACLGERVCVRMCACVCIKPPRQCRRTQPARGRALEYIGGHTHAPQAGKDRVTGTVMVR